MLIDWDFLWQPGSHLGRVDGISAGAGKDNLPSLQRILLAGVSSARAQVTTVSTALGHIFSPDISPTVSGILHGADTWCHQSVLSFSHFLPYFSASSVGGARWVLGGMQPMPVCQMHILGSLEQPYC